MEAKAREHSRRKHPRGGRLVLISSDGDGGRPPAPPVRIVDSEPRLRGGFRLTDR
jgi:hypothetical protein